MTTIVPGYCADFYYTLDSTFHNNKVDQAGGKYVPYQNEFKAANIWVKRSGSFQPKNYIDDVDFSLTDQVDGTCKVSAKARSEKPGTYLFR